MTKTLEERFTDKVDKTGPNGCWLWTASLDSHGYGQLRNNELGRPEAAHRIAYRLYVGEIGAGLEIDHLCRERRCVNPEHLEAVTRLTNVIRGAGNGSQTRCRQGHAYDFENTGITPDGRRYCRTCVRIRQRRLHGWPDERLNDPPLHDGRGRFTHLRDRSRDLRV